MWKFSNIHKSRQTSMSPHSVQFSPHYPSSINIRSTFVLSAPCPLSSSLGLFWSKCQTLYFICKHFSSDIDLIVTYFYKNILAFFSTRSLILFLQSVFVYTICVLLTPPPKYTTIWVVLKPFFREGNGTPLQYSCLENPMDGGAW